MLATDALGAVASSISHKPFGEVHTSTGLDTGLRFPGQVYHWESELHQNWMRDYDPTTGRYVQGDPLGLVDGASVYGYALQSPGRYTDPQGLFTLADAQASLAKRGVPFDHNFGYSDEAVFNEWVRLEQGHLDWLGELTPCPCCVEDVETSEDWIAPSRASKKFHPGGHWSTRSNRATSGGHGNQCIYDSGGNLIMLPPAAGSADRHSPTTASGVANRYFHDVAPYNRAVSLGRISSYFSVRPAW